MPLSRFADSSTSITGEFTADEAARLAGVLRSEPLPLVFDVIDVTRQAR